MDYRESVSFLFGLGKFAPTPGMVRMEPLLRGLGDPHRGLRVIHVAGTNGKGSTCAFIDSALREMGSDTILFTSPHLHTVRERMRRNGEMISREDFARIASRVRDLCEGVASETGEHPTFFEILAAIMYRWAADCGVDYVVQEVGLGGRFDATNVIREPLVTVITDVDLDHTEVLGSTLAEIAGEKAGIIKPGVPLVVGPVKPEALRVIAGIASDRDAPMQVLHADTSGVSPPTFGTPRVSRCGAIFSYRGVRWCFPEVSIAMLGGHQVRNAALAVAALEAIAHRIDISPGITVEGIGKARWPGRVELVACEPVVILDGAHNTSGARVFSECLGELFADRCIHAVIGIMGDKDASAMLRAMAERITGWVAVTRPPIPRATPEDALKELAEVALGGAQGVSAHADPDDAVDAVLARANPGDVVVVWGSLYLVGAVRGRWVPDHS